MAADEIQFAGPQWAEYRRFAVLQDITGCLRIGDVTVFHDRDDDAQGMHPAVRAEDEPEAERAPNCTDPADGRLGYRLERCRARCAGSPAGHRASQRPRARGPGRLLARVVHVPPSGPPSGAARAQVEPVPYWLRPRLGRHRLRPSQAAADANTQVASGGVHVPREDPRAPL